MVMHVHTEGGQDLDMVNGEVINPYTVWGYAQKGSQGLAQKPPTKTKDDGVFHVHTDDNEDIDPIHGEIIPTQLGYA